MAMSPAGKVGIGMAAAILLVFILPLPGILTFFLVGGILVAPIALYFTLTPEQRRRIKRMRERGQLGR